MKDIAVFFGGVSPEHDVSVLTGIFALNAIDKSEFRPIPVYVHSDGKWYTGDALWQVDFFKNFSLKRLKEVCVLPSGDALYIIKGGKLRKLAALSGALNCMHGGAGENGAIAGLMEICGIPLASPSVAPSAVAMNKSLTKIVAKGLGIDSAKFTVVSRKSFFASAKSTLDAVQTELGLPVIVKPNSGGSSIGISAAKTTEQLFSALETAFRFDETAICEEFLIDAFDVNCAAYSCGGEIVVSECERPVTAGEILSFDDKYRSGENAVHEFPAIISEKARDKIRETTRLLYERLAFSGIVRMDFLVSGEKVWLNEINSVPGSLAYYLFSERISDFSEIVNKLFADSFLRELSRLSDVREFMSGVLFKGGSGVKGAKK